jgi:bacillithiol system protein YtxJ
MRARFNKIESTEQLDELFAASSEKPVVLFKHSVTCPISSDVYHEVSNADVDVNLVIVQTARPISNAIAERTGIRHESPQAIILRDGKAVYNASHYDVSAEDIEEQAKSE